jgi:serine/threonine protein kinase
MGPAGVGSVDVGYAVIAKLGAGGVGEVCCAHDTKLDLDRDVVLKVLRMQDVACPDMRAVHLVDGAGHWVQ